MAIKGILFDKDGTLIAFNNVWGPLYKSMLINHFGYDESRALALLQSTGYEPETGTCRGGSPMAAGTLEQIMEVWWPDLSASVREERRQFVNRNADKNAKNFVEPLLELAPVFDAFHAAGYILGVGTNDSEGSAKRHMEVLDVHHYFDVVLGADSVDVPKPSGQMVRRFAELTGLTPAEVAMVGDNGHDIEEARAGGAGLAIGVLTGNSTAADLEPHADHVIHSVGELLQLLKSLA